MRHYLIELGMGTDLHQPMAAQVKIAVPCHRLPNNEFLRGGCEPGRKEASWI
jgi:hypothetical protein